MSDFKIIPSAHSRFRTEYIIDVAGVKRRDVGDFLQTLAAFRDNNRNAVGRTPFVQWEELAGDRYNVSGRFVVRTQKVRDALEVELKNWWPEFDCEASKASNDSKNWPSHWVELI